MICKGLRGRGTLALIRLKRSSLKTRELFPKQVFVGDLVLMQDFFYEGLLFGMRYYA
jgi:hypothetical protein